jgi:hypothetical protein
MIIELVIIFLILILVIVAFRKRKLVIGNGEKHLPAKKLKIAISATPGIDVKKIGAQISKKIGYKHIHQTECEDITDKIKENKNGTIITGYYLTDLCIPKTDLHLHLTYYPYKSAGDLFEYKNQIMAKIGDQWDKYIEAMGRMSINSNVCVNQNNKSKNNETIIGELMSEINIIRSAWESSF